MRILTRYVFREFCVPLTYCLAGFISIYVLFELFGSFSRLSSAAPGWRLVVEYFAGYLAPYFEWLAPACLMLATLYTMWSFHRHSEITAMRASGIGFFTIVKPLLAAATLMALFTFWVNEFYVPSKAQWAKQFREVRFQVSEMDRHDDIVFHNPVANRTWKVGMTVTPEATVLEDVKVTVDWPDGGRRMTVNAPRAEHLDGQWFFLNPVVFHFDRNGVEMPSPVPELDKLTLRGFPEFTERPGDFLLQNKNWAYCSALDRIRFLKTHPNLSADNRNDYEYDLWAQLFSPLACIVITLFAIPAGIASGRQSVFRGIVSALLMFFSFYGLTIGCMILAKRGMMPPLLAAALPDALFFVIGVVMFRRNR